MADRLENIRLKYDLDSTEIIATVTDNGSNFVKAFAEYGKKLENSDVSECEEDISLEFLEICLDYIVNFQNI